MKKVLLLTAALALVASTALAAGIDLTFNACPGNVGAGGDAGTLDCAGGVALLLLGTFSPAEAIPDLAAIDCIIDLQTTGDLGSAGAFWNFDSNIGCNSLGLSSGQARPTSGCSLAGNVYTNTWGVASSGTAIGARQTGPTICRIAFGCFRPTGLSVAANAKLFGAQVIIDGSNAVELGGTCDGCALGANLLWQSCLPGSLSGLPTTTLISSAGAAGATNLATANGGAGLSVATKKHTWGQLKSLYR